jgi:hypothetical protein
VTDQRPYEAHSEVDLLYGRLRSRLGQCFPAHQVRYPMHGSPRGLALAMFRAGCHSGCKRNAYGAEPAIARGCSRPTAGGEIHDLARRDQVSGAGLAISRSVPFTGARSSRLLGTSIGPNLPLCEPGRHSRTGRLLAPTTTVHRAPRPNRVNNPVPRAEVVFSPRCDLTVRDDFGERGDGRFGCRVGSVSRLGTWRNTKAYGPAA